MKTKSYIFVWALCMLVCVSCNNNAPKQKELIGTWSEPYHVNTMVKSLTFYDNGTCVYADKPDTTWLVVPDYAGVCTILNYSVKNSRLVFTGETEKYSDDWSTYQIVRIKFSTSYSIDGTILTLDSFSYDGGVRKPFDKPLILNKR